MIPFDPECPFPLLDPQSHSYQDAQAHSTQVDHYLGFQFTAIEEALLHSKDYQKENETVQAWQGLPVQAMQTPYTEIRYILSLLPLQAQQTVIDLGCGYGRMGHVIGRHHPDVNFIGYELVRERVLEGQRILNQHPYPKVQLQTCDLSDTNFSPAPADFYFIFDFGSKSALEKTLNDLRKIAQKKQITLIARGRGIRHQIYQNHPWLSQIHPPKIHPHFTIFHP